MLHVTIKNLDFPKPICENDVFTFSKIVVISKFVRDREVIFIKADNGRLVQASKLAKAMKAENLFSAIENLKGLSFVAKRKKVLRKGELAYTIEYELNR